MCQNVDGIGNLRGPSDARRAVLIHCRTIRQSELEPRHPRLSAIHSMDTVLKYTYARQIIDVSSLLYL